LPAESAQEKRIPMEQPHEQQIEPRLQHEPTTPPSEAELADEQLDQVAGGREISGLGSETQVVED
jgi:hypothetical protein